MGREKRGSTKIPFYIFADDSNHHSDPACPEFFAFILSCQKEDAQLERFNHHRTEEEYKWARDSIKGSRSRLLIVRKFEPQELETQMPVEFRSQTKANNLAFILPPVLKEKLPYICLLKDALELDIHLDGCLSEPEEDYLLCSISNFYSGAVAIHAYQKQSYRSIRSRNGRCLKKSKSSFVIPVGLRLADVLASYYYQRYKRGRN